MTIQTKIAEYEKEIKAGGDGINGYSTNFLLTAVEYYKSGRLNLTTHYLMQLQARLQAYKEAQAEIMELKEKLIKASEDNDWEYGYDDGSIDGYIVISGKEFIEQTFQEKKE